eukprot:CAMPEP_0117514904 /NCGR_PEP_ID=MMETSP0784-20121206/30306_1 /TAXON_ID=39447 /ORGANISM="" /LENGTH=397 /DNA_ID=CAMNT_0005310707 /DNA_START=3 /DNA_END=1197 /DNA_ORIENTATION=-
MEEPYEELTTPRAPVETAHSAEDPGFAELAGDEGIGLKPTAALSDSPSPGAGPADAVATVTSAAATSAAAIAEMTSRVWNAHAAGHQPSDEAHRYEELATPQEFAASYAFVAEGCGGEAPAAPMDTNRPAAATTAAVTAAITEMTSRMWGVDVASPGTEQPYMELSTPRVLLVEEHSQDDPGFVALAAGDTLETTMAGVAGVAIMESDRLCLEEGNARGRDLRNKRLFWVGRICCIRFYVGWTVYIGPHWPCSICMLAMICGIGGFFTFRVAVELGVAHVLMSLLVTLGSSAAFLSCALADPGILRPCPEAGADFGCVAQDLMGEIWQGRSVACAASRSPRVRGIARSARSASVATTTIAHGCPSALVQTTFMCFMASYAWASGRSRTSSSLWSLRL